MYRNARRRGRIVPRVDSVSVCHRFVSTSSARPWIRFVAARSYQTRYHSTRGRWGVPWTTPVTARPEPPCRPRAESPWGSTIRRNTQLYLYSLKCYLFSFHFLCFALRIPHSLVFQPGQRCEPSCSRIRQNLDVGRNSAELWRVQLRFRARFFVIQNAS